MLDLNKFLFPYEDIEAEDNAGYTALHGAHSLDVVKYLHANGATNISKGLMIAAVHGQLDTLKYLMDNQADINTKYVEGETVLIGAVCCEKLEIVDYVIEKGANIHDTNDAGNTALHQAAYWGYLNIVKFTDY